MQVKVIPTIFVRKSEALEARLEQYEGMVDRVQLDVADESFTSEPTLSTEKMVSWPTTLDRDVHLMTLEPADWLEIGAKEGIKTAIGQIENMSSQREFVAEAKTLGLKAGLAIDLETDLQELDWPVAKKADQLLVMMVRAGKEGQTLSQEGLKRVRLLRQKGFEKEICVDGGVNEKTIAVCVKAGADLLAVGSCLWQAEEVGKQYRRLKELAEQAQTG